MQVGGGDVRVAQMPTMSRVGVDDVWMCRRAALCHACVLWVSVTSHVYIFFFKLIKIFV